MYTHDELDELQDRIFRECFQIRSAKNADYSRGEEALQAFKEAAKKLSHTPEGVLATYMNKHLRAIWTYIEDPEKELKSESLDERVKDTINYLIFLLAMKHEREYLQNTEKQDENEGD